LHPIPGLLLLLVPLCYALVALMPNRSATAPGSLWARGQAAAGVALALALAAAVGLGLSGGGSVTLLELLPLGNLGALDLSVRLDVLTGAMLLLVTFIGFLILRFSRRYLDGDPGQARYVRWFLATLAAVTLLVVTNNLLLLALAWIGTSLALHHLLTHYADRPQALIAAHKKFIASRVADLCMLAAVALTGWSFGTLELDAVFDRLASLPAPPGAILAAAVLFAGAAALKCAQLPFHGWLIQVMEAPTPVSALLHAGVVNIGGFLMIRLAPLMAQADLAQTLLVMCGSVTAVVAALVMTTRISIKVALAWSTCAQMGFMLLECGLGAYGLALLHLVAHSLYKAHAFLSSGSVVEQWRAQSLAATRSRPGLAAWFGAAALSLALVAGVGLALGTRPSEEPALWAFTTVVALALTPLAVRGFADGWQRFATLVPLGAGVAALYFAWHAIAVRLLPAAPPGDGVTAVRIAIVLVAFAVLFVLQAILSARPHGGLARALHPWLFAGLYLDELFTRLTFRVWPARLPQPARPVPARLLDQEG
jgi:NAD(P)H-quinone oxidoreductase subunit 5